MFIFWKEVDGASCIFSHYILFRWLKHRKFVGIILEHSVFNLWLDTLKEKRKAMFMSSCRWVSYSLINNNSQRDIVSFWRMLVFHSLRKVDIWYKEWLWEFLVTFWFGNDAFYEKEQKQCCLLLIFECIFFWKKCSYPS